MKKIACICTLLLVLCSCDIETYLEGKTPAEQIAILDQAIEDAEGSIDSAPVGGWQSPELAGADAVIDEFARASIQKYKRRRAEILDANPELRTQLASNQSAGSGANLSSLSIGSVAGSVSLSGLCGMPENSVTETKRRAWYNEQKAIASAAFQNDASARAEILSIATPPGYSSVCEAAGKQVYAFLPSLNQSIQSSDRLHNGPPIGLRCGVGGASGRTACTSVAITYGLMTTSYMCHQACNAKK